MKYRDTSVDDFTSLEEPIEYINFCDGNYLISKDDSHTGVVIYSEDSTKFLECVMCEQSELDLDAFNKCKYLRPRGSIRIKIPNIYSFERDNQDYSRTFADEIIVFNKPFIYRICQINLDLKKIETIQSGMYTGFIKT